MAVFRKQFGRVCMSIPGRKRWKSEFVRGDAARLAILKLWKKQMQSCMAHGGNQGNENPV